MSEIEPMQIKLKIIIRLYFFIEQRLMKKINKLHLETDNK